MAFRLVWAPAIPFLVALVVLAGAAWMDRGWSPVVLIAGGAWSAWLGLASLATMGWLPAPDLLGVLAFSLAVSELGFAGSAVFFAWVRRPPD